MGLTFFGERLCFTQLQPYYSERSRFKVTAWRSIGNVRRTIEMLTSTASTSSTPEFRLSGMYLGGLLNLCAVVERWTIEP